MYVFAVYYRLNFRLKVFRCLPHELRMISNVGIFSLRSGYALTAILWFLIQNVPVPQSYSLAEKSIIVNINWIKVSSPIYDLE